MSWQLLLTTSAVIAGLGGGSGPDLSPHRYWRVNCYGNQAGFGVALSIAELELREYAFGANVATGGTVIYSAQEGASPATNAFDGNPATYWSKNGNGPEWIGYDFGGGNEKYISEIAITARNDTSFGQAPGCGYVEYSDNGTTWTKAWPFGAFSQITTGATQVHTKPDTASTSHRYWRLGLCGSHLSGTSDYPISLAELEMRPTVGGGDQTSGKTASASTSFSGSTLPANAIDDSLPSIWASTGTASEPSRYSWFKVDFASGVAVSQIALTTRTNISLVGQYPLGISLWFSDDDTNWNLADCWSQSAAPTAENETFTYATSYVPSGNLVAAYDGLFANMQGVYSLKKRVSSYTGPAVRIYDSATTAEQDVGFDSNGRLNSFTVTGEALVKTWYDQKTNNDLTQATPAQMPRLLVNGGPAFQPAIEFRMLTDEWLETTGWTGYTNALAITRPVVLLASTYETDALFQALAMVSHSTTHVSPYGRWLIGRNGARKIDFRWDGAVVATSSGPDTYGQWQPLILDGATSGTNIRMYYGEEATYNDYANSVSNTYPSTSRLIIGANASGGEGATMLACEMVIASSAPSGSYTDIFTEVEKWNDFSDTGFDTTNTSFDDIPYITPVLGGGMVKRNPAYSGPAIRVYNVSTLAETDVNFDVNGFVTGTRPYGTDTRLHTIYDQWGSEDLVVVGTPDATLIEEDSTYKCWRIQWNGASYLATASTTSTPGAWVLDTCAWAIGLIRTASRVTLHNVWGVESTTNFMDVGLWIDTTDAHARLDGGSALDVRGTHYTTNAARVAGVLAPVTGVVGGQNNGIIRCNGEDLATSTAYGMTYPISWDAGKPLCLGGWTGLGSGCLEQTTEFHYFSRSDNNASATSNDGFHQIMNERMKQVLV